MKYQFVVSYQSLEEFKQAIDAVDDELIMRIGHREFRIPQGAGMLIRHFVIFQTRIGDEIHLIKVIGELYQYWGKEFEDHQKAREAALAWSGKIEALIASFCNQAGLILRPGYWQVPDIDKIPGFSWSEVKDAR